ncbi:MAG: hypothetical protein QG671_3441 [Actinomycetota bacterium]|nr:hypothetical protein [Actinomycetota bacterium]
MRINRLRMTITTLAATMIASVGVAILPVGAVASEPLPAPSVAAPVSTVELAPAQKAELLRLTSTPAKKALFLKNLQLAFGGIATVGYTPGTSTNSVGTAHSASKTAHPFLAAGWDRDHFWITMSYADAANGAINGAYRLCTRYLPGFICGPISGVLRGLVAGQGSASNHGVWGAVYLYGGGDRRPLVTGARW